MPASKRQQRANKQNAKKSTGPKTKKGKARSSRNALKHGLLAKSVILQAANANENKKEFDALLADLVTDLQPTNLIEETLVERIATCYWRLRRAHRFEGHAIDRALDTPDPLQLQISDLQQRLTDEQATLDDQLRALQLLDIPTQKRSQSQQTELINSIKRSARRYPIPPAAQNEKNPEAHLRSAIQDVVAITTIKTAALQRKIRATQARQPKHVNDAYATPLASDTLLKIVRYETMLDRQIHRAMIELRRLRSTADPIVPSS